MRKEVFTAPEVAKICRVSRFTVNDWINKGIIKAFRPSDKGVWRVTRNDLKDFMKERGYPIEFLNDSKIRVLVVDNDEKIISLFLLEFRNEINFEMDTANSGFTAGLKLMEFRPDIVVLDIVLDDIDGREFFNYIRSNPKLKDIKVIAISGKIEPSEEEIFTDMGFCYFLRKPFNMNEIRNVILNIMEEKVF